jgi:hypothetical protein
VRDVVAALRPAASAFVTGGRWRQLEYSFPRTLMGGYVDFARVSADALDTTVPAEGLRLEPASLERLLAAFGFVTCRVNRLDAPIEWLGQELRLILSSLEELPALLGGR